jgi:hypothetical protein
MFKSKKCSNFEKMFKFEKVQILKIFKKIKKEKEQKNKRKRETGIKQEKMKKEKSTQKMKNLPTATLTGRPSIAPTRAERSSAPLTGGA